MGWLTTVIVDALWMAAGAWFLKWVHQLAWEFGLGKERRRKLPPGNLGYPIIGNMLDFFMAFKFSSNPDSFIASFHKRYKHIGIYKSFMFGSPTILLTTPETCKPALMDDDCFKPGWPKATNELIGKRSFLFIHNEEHKRLRKLTSSSINGFDALSTYLTYIEDVVVSTLDKWSKMDSFLFLTEMRRTTFRIIMHIFLSSESESIMAEMEKVYTDLNYGMRALAIDLPGFAYHKALKARKRLVEILKSVLDERRAIRSNKNNACSKGKDLMDSLIDVEDEDGGKLSDDEIIDILIMYLNAGHESSAHITMWTTIYLQQNPDIFRKAKKEQEAIRRSFPALQKGLTLRDFRKMMYLSKVIDESLRVVSLSFVAFREAVKDVEVYGYLIPKGWKVQMWYRSIHMNPKYYPDPKKFDPDRSPPKATTFLPFGGGSRLCPGNDLAKLEISVFLHHFLLNYELVRLNPDCPLQYLPHPRPTDNCPAKLVKVSKKAV